MSKPWNWLFATAVGDPAHADVVARAVWTAA